MNEFFQPIAEAARPVLCLLILALGTYLVSLLRKATNNIEKQTDSKTADKYIEMAYEAVATAVMATAQTFVDALKAENAFTKEKQLEAFNIAKQTALAILGETAVAALTEIYGDFDTWINTEIEAQCRGIKRSDKATSAVSLLYIDDETEAETETEPETEAEPMEDPEALHHEAVASTFMHDSYE